MPSLDATQKQQVAAWVNEGHTLSDIQKKITEDFDVHLTYMDVRFLVDDLDLTLVDKTPAHPEPAAATTTAETPGADTLSGNTPASDGAPDGLAPDSVAPAPGGSVRVAVDPVQRPGVLVGGSVTFSDGQTAQWQMDQYGQLGFVPPFPGYKPAPADVQQFQVSLDNELRKLGY